MPPPKKDMHFLGAEEAAVKVEERRRRKKRAGAVGDEGPRPPRRPLHNSATTRWGASEQPRLSREQSLA